MREQLISQAEAAEILGVHRITVFRWVKEGRLGPTWRKGRCVLMPESVVLEFDRMRMQMIQPAEESAG